MRNHFGLVLLCAVIAIPAAEAHHTASAAARIRPGLKIFSLPAADPQPPGRPTFGAILLGGAGDVDDATRFLCRHAHGDEVVVLRASGTDAYNPYFHQLCPNNSVSTLLITSPEGAADPAAIRRVRDAHAIFFAGGDQSNYVRFWPGPMQREIDAAIARGVPIGGISAGLAVLGEFVFSARHDTITSPEAFANPFDPKLTLDRNFLSIPVLRGIITDSHFSERSRMGRTVAFLARILHDGWADPARAIGIDQETAVLVEADGKAAVVGKGSAYFLELAHQPERCAPGKSLTVHGVQAYAIRGRPQANGTAGFDLKSWTGRGGASFMLDVANGVMTRTSRQTHPK
ncbi:MAG TPA: cyanophycinase [Candidatus Acidoferrales bacterium]|nr:cyanophycinase [Candidatus Acidoferrales bacterium]